MDDWQQNTFEKPFWKAVSPVEVMFADGKIQKLSCPKCARGLFSKVIKWRKISSAN